MAMATDAEAAAAAPSVDPATTHALPPAAEAEAGETGAALGPDGEHAASASRHLACAGCLEIASCLDPTTTASLPCTCAAPFRLPSDAAAWRVCAPWDARVLLTRAELDVLLLPAKRKGDYSAADYE